MINDTTTKAHGMAISSDGTHLYATSSDGTVLAYHVGGSGDLRHPTTATSQAERVLLSADGAIACVAGTDTTLSMIDTVRRIVVGTISTPGNVPCGVAVSPDGTRLYVAYIGGTGILAYDTTDLAERPIEITLHAAPHSIVVSPDNTRVYAAGPAGRSVEVIDATVHRRVSEIYIHGAALHLAISPDGAFIYVANADNGTVTVIESATERVYDTIVIGASPSAVAISPDGGRLHVLDQDCRALTALDVSGYSSTTSALH